MSGQDGISANDRFDFYRGHYGRFDSKLAAEVRREVYGEDLGQTGWRTAAEQVEIADHLRLGPNSRVLDIACGAGGASLALVERTGCQITGVDIEPTGIEHANAEARARGLADRSTFAVVDCSGRLAFEDGAFNAVLCIDAISHLSDRFGTLSEWGRLLSRGGRLLFTNSSVLTGAVAKSELDIRGGIGTFLLVPPGLDEEAIEAAGLTLLKREDRTAATAEIAGRLYAARTHRAAVWSARRAPTGSGSGSAYSRPRPSWLRAVGCRASSTSPRSLPSAQRRSEDSPYLRHGMAGTEEAWHAPPGSDESFVCSCALAKKETSPSA